jgi:hypothetical protein
VPRRQCRNDKASKNQIYADELHRLRNHQCEQHIESNLTQSRAIAEPDCQSGGVEQCGGPQTCGLHIENLSNEQIFEMLAPVRIVRKDKELDAGRDNEQHADESFLNLRPFLFGPGESQRSQQSRGSCGYLNPPSLRFKTHRVGGRHTQSRHLCDREVDEHDAARQHLLAQGHMGRKDQHPGKECRKENAEFDRAHGLSLSPPQAAG